MMEIKVGHCKQCGACCRYEYRQTWAPITEQAIKRDNGEFQFFDFRSAKKIATGENNGNWEQYYFALPAHCTHLKRKDKKYSCDLHGTKEQPEMCRVWPQKSRHEFYKAVNTLFGCGYFFIEIDVECPQPLG